MIDTIYAAGMGITLVLSLLYFINKNSDLVDIILVSILSMLLGVLWPLLFVPFMAGILVRLFKRW